jgi:hypothetical protein
MGVDGLEFYYYAKIIYGLFEPREVATCNGYQE